MLLLLQKRNLLSVIAGIKFAWNIVSGDVISKTTKGVLFQLFKTNNVTTSRSNGGVWGAQAPLLFLNEKKPTNHRREDFVLTEVGYLELSYL